MTNCEYAKFKDGKFFFPQSSKKVIITSSFDRNNLDEEPFTLQSSKKVIMTSSFDKNNLGEEPFTLGREIHWDKR